MSLRAIWDQGVEFAKAILAMGVMVLLVSCSEETGSKTQSIERGASSEAVQLLQSIIERRSLVEPVVGTGTIAAAKTTDIGPSVEGIIEEIFVHVGDRVEKGQPLFQTRSIEYELRKDELSYQLKLALAENDNAQSQLNRMQDLKKKGVVSAGKFDEAFAAAEIASARFGIAETKLAAATQSFEDTLVMAPYNGVITRKDVNEGRFMSVRGFSMPGQSSGVVQLMQINTVFAMIQIAEVDLPRIKIGTPAKVIIDGVEREFETEIAVVNDLVDVESRSVEIRLGLRNDDYTIKPGLFAKAEIYPAPRSILLVERQSVLGFVGSRYVLINEGGVAKRRAVEVKDLDAEYFEVIDGLREGETILSGPRLRRIDEGSAVTIQSQHQPIDVSQANAGRG